MSLASKQHTFNDSLLPHTNDSEDKIIPDETETNLSTLLGEYTNGQKHPSMERGSTAYSQSGLPTPYPHAFIDSQSENLSADNTSAAQYPPHQEVRSNTYSTSATPTSDYGAAYPPTSARSATFPDHLQRSYHSSNHSSSSGGMAQPTSPSIPLQDGRSTHQTSQIKSDSDVPIDPSISASSPTYATHGSQHPSYAPDQMAQYSYAHQQQQQQHTGGPMYAQPRPNWAASINHVDHGHHPPSHNGMNYAVSSAASQASAAPVGRQVSHLRASRLYRTAKN